MLSVAPLKKALNLTERNRMSKNYFSQKELACQHCGEYFFDEDFLSVLNEIRTVYNRPMVVSSGYRCPDHPIEQAKDNPGAHAKGKAVDIKVAGQDAIDLVIAAGLNGITRIGVKQKGEWNDRFIHLDCDDDLPNAMWSY